MGHNNYNNGQNSDNSLSPYIITNYYFILWFYLDCLDYIYYGKFLSEDKWAAAVWQVKINSLCFIICLKTFSFCI